jgi:8-oxo-dGTP pyrophosphatase MutT (NUDIX family)
MLKRFNVRVYGLMVNEYGEVLVADEQFKSGIRATKFPGGGLELGEGTREGLQREFMEETGIDVVIEEHFYTTDYFQPSFYDDHSQLISIYYIVSSSHWRNIPIASKPFDFEVTLGQEAESFRWVTLPQLLEEPMLNLPVDKLVVKLFCEQRMSIQ